MKTTKIDPYTNKELICQGECLNIGTNTRSDLGCDVSDESHEDGEKLKLCDLVCDNSGCSDESICNGYMYGRKCTVNPENGAFIITPPREICFNMIPCFFDRTGNRDADEQGCDIDGSDLTLTASCVSGEFSRARGVQKIIPIFNYTRCSAIVHSIQFNNLHRSTESGTPYCENYIDQTNCTDETRVAVSCYIQGYGYSTISKTMVCGRFRRGFCLDGIDVACVDVVPGCTLHKHQVCDGVKDCGSGLDEKHPWCADITEKTCYRNYRTNRKLPIPVGWLRDGMVDCLDGIDENWNFESDNRSTIAKDVCEEVFLCRNGKNRFIGLAQLCDGVEKCTNENRICEIGRGLSSRMTFISHQTTLTKDKSISFCLKGLGDIFRKVGPCIAQEFNPFNENVFGIETRPKVSLPNKLLDCTFIFGEPYVILNCLGKCENSKCPLRQPILLQDCAFQKRIFTVANKSRLTFVQRDATTNDYHNDFFVCANSFACIVYDKVCNLIDDCGDGSDERVCSNNFICKESQEILPLSKKCDGYPDCWDISDECNSHCGRDIINQSMLKGAAWFIGSVAVLSNIIVLCENAWSLKDCSSEEALVNKVLILLIEIGDLLTGIYLLFIAISDTIIYGKRYCSRRFELLTSPYCSTIGVISTFGTLLSLLSLTILCIMRALRLLRGGIRKRTDDEDIRCKQYIKIATITCLIITSAAMIASVPLFDVLEDYFVDGILYDQSVKIFHGQIGKPKHLEVIQSYYGRMRNSTLPWKKIHHLIKDMFSSHCSELKDKAAQVEYYGNNGLCTFKYFVTSDDPQRIYSMMVLAINILCFAIVTASYITISIVRLKSSRSVQAAEVIHENVENDTNQRMQRKTTAIIITDFLCRASLILTSLLHFFGVLDANHLHVPFSIMILPINSIINPFLYSDLIHGCVCKFWAKLSYIFKPNNPPNDNDSPEDQEERFKALSRTPDVPTNSKIVEEIPMTAILSAIVNDQFETDKVRNFHQEINQDVV